MNMDFYGYFNYGDSEAVKQFATAHFFAHDIEAKTIATTFGRNIETFNVDGETATEAWIAMMSGDLDEVPEEMYDWLEAHNENHQEMLSIITANTGIQVTSQADLSLVDFRNEEEMYDWLTLHQQMHAFEQKALGLS